jgi:cytochrome c-type biogenesis protein CcmH/NrfG
VASQVPSLDDMKRMADKKAEPVLAKLKADPNNAELLIQVGMIYQATHRFKEAAEYYQKALQIKPDNVAVRTHAASCLYYAGDVDSALAELRRSLIDNPRNADVLFNLGMIKWKGKQDAQGAVNAWQKLLDTNPKLDATKKAQVQRLIAEARQHGKPGFTPPNQVSKE